MTHTSLLVYLMAAITSADGMSLVINAPGANALLAGQSLKVTGSSPDSGTIFYRFRVRRPGADYQMIRDYGPLSSLDWAADREGAFQLEVSAKNFDTGDVATSTQSVSVGTRVTGEQVVVNATDHPLVFLFSAPPCARGGRMRVKFQTSSGPAQWTPFKACEAGLSMNFYLAGTYAQTSYTAQAELDTGDAITPGDILNFTTGALGPFSWNETVITPSPPNSTQNILLATSGGSQIATDLIGRVIWFNPSPMSYATAFEAGGYLWGYLEDDTKPVEQQGIRKVDLVGHTILETNAARVNEQLAAIGKRKISGFHHEARTLPDGRIVALASVEQLLTDVQGPGTVDVLGDMVIVFDANLQVLWTWDTFDHLDPARQATLNETCAPGGGGCSPFYLAAVANDWTHGNAVRQTPDGNLIYSARHQDWVIKISYANGEGDGHIIWKLGKDGDFAYAGSDAYPWFSHQHDPNFESENRMTVFDNGNVRITANGGNSRGQVIELDEQNRTAVLRLDADLGVYSWAVGSAQRLRNGDHHFDAGYVPVTGGLTAYALEVNKSGQVESSLEANTLLYRSFRLMDLYSPN